MTDPRADVARLAKAYRRMWAARHAFNDAVVACLPAGATVKYKHGTHWRRVVVVENSFPGARVLVRGAGGVYSLDPRRFLP